MIAFGTLRSSRGTREIMDSGLHPICRFCRNLLLRTQIVRACRRWSINVLTVRMIRRTHSIAAKVRATAGRTCVLTQMISRRDQSV